MTLSDPRRPSSSTSESTPMRLLLFLSAVLLLHACGSNPSSSSSAFVTACEDATDWPTEMCECAESKARAELSDATYAFVAASMTEDDAETARLRDRLSFTEATEGGLFMMNAAAECSAAEAP